MARSRIRWLCCEPALLLLLHQPRPHPAPPPQLLGWHLDSKGWAAARSVCQSWRANITADIKLLEVDLERDAHRCEQARLLPLLLLLWQRCHQRQWLMVPVRSAARAV